MGALTYSSFATGLNTETAFDVLAVANRLKAAGKEVYALQIGDSPFPSSASALKAGKDAIDAGLTRYCPSLGVPAFREAAAKMVKDEFGIPATAANIVVGPGAKPFETFFCEAFLEPGDDVLLFSPAFPTFEPNVLRRGAKPAYYALKQENGFRPNPKDVEHFLTNAKKPKAIFLNSPHNPTGGVATPEDLKAIADLIRGKNIALLSDEPYCHMVWEGKHASILAEPGMMDQCVGAYTFSKSYSMSGWRLGFAVAAERTIDLMGKMINTSVSCVPPIVQMAGKAAIENDTKERTEVMAKFHKKVEMLVQALKGVDGVDVAMPKGTFYVFPNVRPICERLRIKSHGLAMYLLEGADDKVGVACLGGECFGSAGEGFLRFSCAETDDRILAAVEFLKTAITKTDQVQAYLEANPKYRAG
jgi:aspartate aminotransferase